MIFDSNDHKFLIPAVTILGALIAVVSDIIAQLPGHQQVLPINVVTSLIGVPVVLWVLLHRQRGNR
jgi:iron complex transport system permease protein